jgi:1-acyl-sn-glycerol-3-phosphate acyltransferase
VSNLSSPSGREESIGFSYRLGRLFFRVAYACFFRAHYFNPERVPEFGPVILASNHASFIDPPLVGVRVKRPISFLARETLFRFPGVGVLLRSWNAVPVDREGGGAAGLRKIFEVLEAGRTIVIFPEGTRTRDGQLQRARSGIGLLVIKSDAQVVPVRVFGTFQAFGRHCRLPRPRPVSVKFGRPLDFQAKRVEARTCGKARLKEIYQEVADDIMAAVAKLQPYEDREAFPPV